MGYLVLLRMKLASSVVGSLLAVVTCAFVVAGAACSSGGASDASGDGGAATARDGSGGTYVPSADGGTAFHLDVKRARTASGADFSCALLTSGDVKCWGRNDKGQLGIGDKNNRADNAGEMGDKLPAVSLGEKAVSIAVGWYHACALLESGRIKCWGQNDSGQLGQGDTKNRADDKDEMGDALPAIPLGGGTGTAKKAVAIAAGGYHNCAVFEDGSLKCWGANLYGQLGLGDAEPRGDQAGELGDSLPFVDLGAGRKVVAIAAGNFHTCAVLENGALKCWGDGADGQTGLGAAALRGKNPGDMGDNLEAVNLGGGAVVQVACGGFHTCAILGGGALKCWGHNDTGQQGQGDTTKRGANPGDMGAALKAVDFGNGRKATYVSTLYDHSCAVLDDGSVRCWGWNNAGQLGLGDKETRGDAPGEMGTALPKVDLGLGVKATQLGVGWDHSCALLEGDAFKCWGLNWAGHLGQGDTATRGDGPNEMGDALKTVKLTGP